MDILRPLHALSSLSTLSLLPNLSLGRSLTRHRTTTTIIRMGGGPRTFPGGVSKWEWKRMQAKKSKQLLKARLARERQIYEMRKRAELKAAVSDLERPWEVVSRAAPYSSALFSVSADEQLKVLADRFQKAGGFDLWSQDDGPQLFESPDGIPTSRFLPKGVVHSLKPYNQITEFNESSNSGGGELRNGNDSSKPYSQISEFGDFDGSTSRVLRGIESRNSRGGKLRNANDSSGSKPYSQISEFGDYDGSANSVLSVSRIESRNSRGGKLRNGYDSSGDAFSGSKPYSPISEFGDFDRSTNRVLGVSRIESRNSRGGKLRNGNDSSGSKPYSQIREFGDSDGSKNRVFSGIESRNSRGGKLRNSSGSSGDAFSGSKPSYDGENERDHRWGKSGSKIDGNGGKLNDLGGRKTSRGGTVGRFLRSRDVSGIESRNSRGGNLRNRNGSSGDTFSGTKPSYGGENKPDNYKVDGNRAKFKESEGRERSSNMRGRGRKGSSRGGNTGRFRRSGSEDVYDMRLQGDGSYGFRATSEEDSNSSSNSNL